MPEGEAVAGARVLAVANQKGGVGKTTTAVNLGAALAEAGQRVIVVDLDPQGNASTGLGVEPVRRVLTSYDVLTGRADARDALVDTAIPGLLAMPSTADLAGAEIELVGESARETSLKRALAPLLVDEVVIFLDCPPSLGLLTVNALAAATEVIVPIQCEYFALEGLGQLIKNLRLVQRGINPNLRLNGIVLTMYDARTKLAEQVVAEIRGHFGSAVYRTTVPRSVRLSEAPGYGLPIARYDPTSAGAKAYRSLAAEFLLHRPSDEPIGTGLSRAAPTSPAPDSGDEELSGRIRRGEGVDAPPLASPTTRELVSADVPAGPIVAERGPMAEPATVESSGPLEEREMAVDIRDGSNEPDPGGALAPEEASDVSASRSPGRDQPVALTSQEAASPAAVARRRRFRWPFGRSKGGRR
jgi:chromosome partitioning protein